MGAVIRRSRQLVVVWFFAWDLSLTAAAWVGAYLLRFSGLFPVAKDQPEFALCLRNLPLVLILASVAFHLGGMYLVHRLRRGREEVVAVAKGSALLSLLVMATTFYRHDPYESRGTMVLFTALTAAGVVSIRRPT